MPHRTPPSRTTTRDNASPDRLTTRSIPERTHPGDYAIQPTPVRPPRLLFTCHHLRLHRPTRPTDRYSAAL